eukprot:TRINITY_DN11197_c0_g1_i1.p1 TRINITY_DN11197_c0_g1~~TRINITY_DN11197_c0_g1_i1.p1  ORF type:complete len:215 (-),score=30.39 TRINITY_DN11197_c0_g1_i1:32-601(-)
MVRLSGGHRKSISRKEIVEEESSEERMLDNHQYRAFNGEGKYEVGKNEKTTNWFRLNVCNCCGDRDSTSYQKKWFWFDSPKYLLWVMHWCIMSHMVFCGVYVVLFIGEDEGYLVFIYSVMVLTGIYLSLYLLLPWYTYATSMGHMINKRALEEVCPNYEMEMNQNTFDTYSVTDVSDVNFDLGDLNDFV